ncbi:hypothetical protein B0H10DRAFT_2242752 [Mycena sp. CBHHK59/15]|nr:hypothetical protein B0H10DRAFT_2242752 [Mycena sp. CBHHK59/15]
MAQTQARLGVVAAITELVKNIEDLDAVLPSSIAKGTDSYEIYCVLTTIHGMDEGSADSTFNHRFDILFKEDTQCRDANGRLHLICRASWECQWWSNIIGNWLFGHLSGFLYANKKQY